MKYSGLIVKKTFILFGIHLQQVTGIRRKGALLLRQLKLPLFNQLNQGMCHAHFKPTQVGLYCYSRNHETPYKQQIMVEECYLISYLPAWLLHRHAHLSINAMKKSALWDRN